MSIYVSQESMSAQVAARTVSADSLNKVALTVLALVGIFLGIVGVVASMPWITVVVGLACGIGVLSLVWREIASMTKR